MTSVTPSSFELRRERYLLRPDRRRSRWRTRVVLLSSTLLALLFLALWVGGQWYWISWEHVRAGEQSVRWERLYSGPRQVGWGTGTKDPGSPGPEFQSGWTVGEQSYAMPLVSEDDVSVYRNDDGWVCCGFEYKHMGHHTIDGALVVTRDFRVPLWFITVASLGPAVLVYWRRRV